MISTCDAALAYAARGWYVFPCAPDKRPLTSHGCHDASIDTATITDWWGRYPDACIGVACGPSNLVVIDADDHAVAAWERIATLREWANTRIHRTPSGGMHYIYTHDYASGSIKNTVRHPDLCEVDIRADGGYIIVPPSIAAHGEYTVVRDVNPAPLPDTLREILVRGRRLSTRGGTARTQHDDIASIERLTIPGDIIAQLARGAVEGERNDTCYRLARRMRACGIPQSVASQLITVMYCPACIPPYPADEAVRTVQSAYASPADDSESERVYVLPPYRSLTSAAKDAIAILMTMPDVYVYRPCGQEPLLVRADANGIHRLGDADLYPLISASGYTPVRLVDDGSVPAVISPSMARDIWSAMMHHLTATPSDKTITRYTRLPVWSGGWKTGYVPEHNIYSAACQPQPCDERTARERLVDLLQGYAVASPADMARQVAGILAPGIISSCVLSQSARAPMIVTVSSVPGAGKGTYYQTICAVYGAQPYIVTHMSGVGGLDEQISSALQSGAAIISLDNLRGVVDSRMIETIMTEPVAVTRVPYGKPTPVETAGIVIYAGGVMHTMTPDLARRSCPIYLAGLPSTDTSPLARVQAERDHYAAAVYYWIERGIRAWQAMSDSERANRIRAQVKVWQNYAEWAAITDIIVQAIGLPSIAHGLVAARKTSANRHMSAINTLLQAASDIISDAPVCYTIGQIIDAAGSRDPTLLDKMGIAATAIDAVRQIVGRYMRAVYHDAYDPALGCARIGNVYVLAVDVPDQRHGMVRQYAISRKPFRMDVIGGTNDNTKNSAS